jgi:hypothetical protein
MTFRHETFAWSAGLRARGPALHAHCFGSGGGSASTGNVSTITTSHQVGASDQAEALYQSSGNVIKRGTDITGSTISIQEIAPQLAGQLTQLVNDVLAQQTQSNESLRGNEQDLVAQVLAAQSKLASAATPDTSKEMMYVGLALAAVVGLMIYRKG